MSRCTTIRFSRARNKIKHYINTTERVKAVEIGQKYLEKEARRLGVTMSRIASKELSKVASEYGYSKAEDLYAALSARTPADGGDLASSSFFGEFLSVPEDTRFDVVLAWDLFDYLQRKELAAFAEQLRNHTNRGALIFALISYHKTIPAQPYRFRIKDDQHLIYERRTGVERPSPRLAPAEVTNLLKEFRVDRSFLLKHGIQEYLLVRE